MSRRLGFAMAIMGGTATVAQVVAMRELVVVFYGNELFLGILLASWLVCTALGSALAGRIARRITHPGSWLAGLQGAIALVLPLTVLAARASLGFWGLSQGQAVGLLPMTVTPPLVVGPLCVLLGLLYTLGCKATGPRAQSAALAIGRVYVQESLGATLGGLLASFVLIRYLHALSIVALLASVNLISAWALVLSRPWPRTLGIGTGALAGIAALLALATPLHRWGNGLLWRGYRLLHTENTPYANVAVVSVEETTSFFENGLISFTYPVPESAENLVHLALLQHPHPSDMLLVGGGLGGALQEALKLPSLRRLDYVELDPRVIALGRQYLPPEATSGLDDPRVHVHYLDGRLYVQTTTQLYDVVIIGLPEPRTTMVNRFFTREFFVQVKRVLKPGGIVSFAVSSSENVIGEALARFLACLRNTLASVFPEVVVFPGNTAHYFASLPPTSLSTEAERLLQRLRARGVETTFIREYYLPFRLAPARVGYLNRVLDRHHEERINTDFAPVAYFFDLVLWSRQVSPTVVRVLDAIPRGGTVILWAPALVATALFLLAAKVCHDKRALVRWAVGWAVWCIGFAGIALEVASIIAFQALYGYVYYRVSLLVTAFMAGLAMGGLAGNRFLSRSKGVGKRFRLVLGALALLPVVTVGAMFLLARAHGWSGAALLGQVAFPLLLLASGFLTGYLFPLANELFARAGARLERTAGTVYAVDLLGACVGAAAASTLLIPVLGLPRTMIALALLSLSALVACSLSLRKE